MRLGCILTAVSYYSAGGNGVNDLWMGTLDYIGNTGPLCYFTVDGVTTSDGSMDNFDSMGPIVIYNVIE